MLRVKHQAKELMRGDSPDNYLSPKEISKLEREHLKDAFKVIKTLQDARQSGVLMTSSTLVNNPLLSWLFGYEAKRKKLLKKAPEGALRDFLTVPLPNINTPINRLSILSVDFETTGLDAKLDKLLSVGFVELKNKQIPLRSCYHQIINTQMQLEESNVIIHHITDSQKRARTITKNSD